MIIMIIYNNLSCDDFMQLITELQQTQEMCYFGQQKQCDNCGECPN